MPHPALANPELPCKYGHIGERYNSGACKTCAKIRARNWELNNPDKVKFRIRGPVKHPRNLPLDRPCPQGHISSRYPNGRCRTCARVKSKEWAERNPEQKRTVSAESQRRVRKRNPEKAREKSRKDGRRRYAKVPEVMGAAAKKWRKDNPEKYREIHNRWRRARPGSRAAEVAARRARKKNATPAWADTQRIKEVYKRAKRIGKCLGIRVQIDHIVPLQSDFVCGLHVPWNLQILTAELNVKKSNKVWPDMTPWS